MVDQPLFIHPESQGSGCSMASGIFQQNPAAWASYHVDGLCCMFFSPEAHACHVSSIVSNQNISPEESASSDDRTDLYKYERIFAMFSRRKTALSRDLCKTWPDS
jgi:hypothetical protein